MFFSNLPLFQTDKEMQPSVTSTFAEILLALSLPACLPACLPASHGQLHHGQ